MNLNFSDGIHSHIKIFIQFITCKIYSSTKYRYEEN